MWKISRNLIFPRWHVNKQTPVEAKPKKSVCSKALAPFTFEKKRHSDESHGKKENFRKDSKRFWNCDQFQYLFKPLFFETAGWLGAVTVLCFNFHAKYFNSHYENDRKKFHCIFSRNVFAMPENIVESRSIQSQILSPHKPFPLNEELKDTEAVSEPHFLDDLQINTRQYMAALQNSAGVTCLDSNSKKAFRHFQTAARLGSSQGLYNLGLCYELGKGTKVNLNRAAFCYRKAALKGHGLASFNLAIFFLKGLGGLPVDSHTAKLLLAEAADKDVPEAQIFMGLECLEEKKWSEAFQVFDNLAQKNILDGKYYLGLCYSNGWGVNQDVKIAAEIFSQAAAVGHSKSILKLSKCYEEGFGSCEPDLDFAEALCQILVDQNDEEGKKALQRLQIKKENLYLKDLFEFKVSSLKLGERRPNIHVSSSVPQLPTNKLLKTKYHSSFTSCYLDLIPPFPSKKNSLHDSRKPSFFIGEDKLNLSIPTAYAPCYQSNNMPIMTAKT